MRFTNGRRLSLANHTMMSSAETTRWEHGQHSKDAVVRDRLLSVKKRERLPVAIVMTCLAFAGLGRVANTAAASLQRADYLQLIFTDSLSECKMRLNGSRAPQSASDLNVVSEECLSNVTPASYSHQLPPFVFQTRTAVQLQSSSGAGLFYRAIGPTVLGRNQVGANPRALGAGRVRHYQMMAFTGPRPGMDAQFNDWYDQQHLPDVLRVPGFISAQRFVLVDASVGLRWKLPRYLVLFKFKSGDLEATNEEIRARIKDGRTRMNSAFDIENGVGLFLIRADEER